MNPSVIFSPLTVTEPDAVPFGNVVDLKFQPGPLGGLGALSVSRDDQSCFGRVVETVVPRYQTVRLDGAEAFIIVQRDGALIRPAAPEAYIRPNKSLLFMCPSLSMEYSSKGVMNSSGMVPSWSLGSQ